jgi:hypothetical protein
MAVDGTHYIWSCLVYSDVDSEACWVHSVHVPRLDDDALLVHQTQIFRFHMAETSCKRVDPEAKVSIFGYFLP